MIHFYSRIQCTAIITGIVIFVFTECLYASQSPPENGSTSLVKDSACVFEKREYKQTHDSIIALERMVVTANKRSMNPTTIIENVAVITHENVRNTGVHTAMEMLDCIPGVDINSARTQTSIVLNGMKGEYVKILLDGIPVTGDVAGGFPLENLLLGDIDRVEVLCGAASTLYGTDAIGGIVNIITEGKRIYTPLGIDISYRYLNSDSIGTWAGKNCLDIEVMHTNKAMRIEGYYGCDLDNGIQRVIYDDFGTYTHYTYPDTDRKKLGCVITLYPFDKLTVKPQFTYSISQSTKSTGTELVSNESNNKIFNVKVDFTPSNQFNWQGYSSVRAFDHLHRNRIQVVSPRIEERRTDFLDYEGEVRCDRFDENVFGGKSCITTGVNVVREHIKSDNLRDDAARVQGGIFTSLTWERAAAVTLIVNPSVRITANQEPRSMGFDKGKVDVSPKIGMRLNNFLFNGAYVSLAYGQAYKVPRLKKMYYGFNMGNSMWIEGNGALLAEKSHQINAGVGYAGSRFISFSVTGFYNRLTDMTVLCPVKNPDGTQTHKGINGEPEDSLDANDAKLPVKTYTNAQRGYASGISLTMKVSPVPWMKLSVAATHTVSAAEDGNGQLREVEHYSPNTVNCQCSFALDTFFRVIPQAHITFIWNDRQIDYNGDTKEYISSAAKLNITVTKNILAGVSLDVAVTNVLNHIRQGYAGFEYGRTYSIGITMAIEDITKFGSSFVPINLDFSDKRE